MSSSSYVQLNALIVDDFASFRGTLGKMLSDFGIGALEFASSGDAALELCALTKFDIIFCDQNLGKGKSGLQVLEALRFLPSKSAESLFVLVSADTNRHTIMAVCDYEPDAYLTKPFTSDALYQRLVRLLSQRDAMSNIQQTIRLGDFDSAINLCREEIDGAGRVANLCQKLLGNLYLMADRLDLAEQHFRTLLEVRSLDWAMFGLAQSKKKQGDLFSAQHWLEDIIQTNPFYVKAYDVLADIFRERSEFREQQTILQKALEISPLSILRHQRLGAVAFANREFLTSAHAYRKAVKLGEFSCHDRMEIHKNFGESVVDVIRIDKTSSRSLLNDALEVTENIPSKFGRSLDNKISSVLLAARLQYHAGDIQKGLDLLNQSKHLIQDHAADISVDQRIAFIKALREMDDLTAASQNLEQLLRDCGNHEVDLQKVDSLLIEPRSEKHKIDVAKINRDGIAFYDAKAFARAKSCFAQALQNFPFHVGLRLNYIQSCVGLMQQESVDKSLIIELNRLLKQLQDELPSDHAQMPRLQQLDVLVKELSSKTFDQRKLHV